jgi:hypothetical protein
MSRWAICLAMAGLALVAGAGSAAGNGETQREVQGRVVAVDARGTITVERQFRGKTTRIALQVNPDTRIFHCGHERAGLDGIKAGALVSVFYEIVGSSEGVVNMLVLERVR